MKKFTTKTLLALSLALSASAFTMPAAPVLAEGEEVLEYADDRLLVQVAEGNDPYEVAEELGIEKVELLGEGKDGWSIFYVTPGEVEAWHEELAVHELIKHREFDFKFFPWPIPTDPAYKDQWHQKHIGADHFWPYGNGRTIAFIDSGVDYYHTDLRYKIVPGYDFVHRDNIADDEVGTGTHLAGIAAATHNNFTGGKGVDPTAKIMPLKVVNKYGYAWSSDIVAAIYWATFNGADVVTVTAGNSTYSSVAMQSAINFAWSYGKFIIADAGNNGSTVKRYPAANYNVYSVAATGPDDKIWYKSNRGSWVDIAAPGMYIYSTKLGGGMYHWSGTEQAAAVTAGAASLIWGSGMTNYGVQKYLNTHALAIPYTGTYWTYGRLNLL